MPYPDDIVTIEDAITAWIVAATGLAASNVLWSQQGVKRPTGTWISILLLGMQRIGHDWTDVEWADTPEPGADVALKLRGLRYATYSIQCFGGPAHGASSPVALLEMVCAKARLPSIAAGLKRAGIGLSSLGAVSAVGDVLNSARFEPRATLEVSLYLASEVSETTTYIETVTAEGTVND